MTTTPSQTDDPADRPGIAPEPGAEPESAPAEDGPESETPDDYAQAGPDQAPDAPGSMGGDNGGA